MGFEIENGFLERYTEEEGVTEVVIPDSVTSIEYAAFSDCSSLKSITIPDSVTSIGDYAFSHCSSLTSITIPDSVTSIGDYAFWDCSSLTSITIYNSVTSIGEGTFSDCSSLTSFTIPDSVTSIGVMAFSDCSSLTSITIPDSVTSIGVMAFSGCSSLTNITISDSVTSIGGCAFSETKWLANQPKGMVIVGKVLLMYTGNETEIVIPDFVTSIGEYAFSGCTNLEITISKSLIDNTAILALKDCKTVHGFEGKFCSIEPISEEWAIPSIVRSDADIAYILVYQKPKVWNEVVKNHIERFGADGILAEFANMIVSDKSKKTKIANKMAEVILTYAKNLSDEGLINAYKFASENKLKKVIDTIESDPILRNIVKDKSSTGKTKSQKSTSEKLQSTNPIEELVKANWVTSPLTADLGKHIKKGVKYADSKEVSSPEAVIFVLNAYLSQMDDTPKYFGEYKTAYVKTHIDETADKVAAALDRNEFMSLINDHISFSCSSTNEYFIPYCRYADGKKIGKLISEMSKWKDWDRYSQTGRRNIIIARGGLLLSDTREAMNYFDKMKLLDHYAELRGTDADTIRDTVLAEFGLESDGTKTYDLGSTTITAQLNGELTITLYDNTAGKVVKSLPKKGSDPALYESASAHLSDMKKNLKKVAKNRNDKLFEAFLNGNSFKAVSWKKTYLVNPLLRQIASMLVWSQKKTTFTISDNGVVTSDGKCYEINDSTPIILAHPMEMKESDVKAWQKYFSDRKLKQPFLQVWEPVVDANFITPDRYDGIEIPFNFLRNSQKHGIYIKDCNFHDELGVSMSDCQLSYDFPDYRRHTLPENIVVTEFKITKLTRQNNHIIALLDRWTIAERIAKDNTPLFTFISNATLAQLTYYIDIANKNNAVNCMAELLEMKNKNYPDFDPMDEYSLDW